MKAVYCCFIALFVGIFGFSNNLKISAMPSVFAADNQTVAAHKNSSLSKGQLVYNNHSSKKAPQKNKKRNRKGVKPLLFCIVNNCHQYFELAVPQTVCFKQSTYHFHAFSGNGKRGPPFTQVFWM